jgi:hypothetical protein
MSEVIAEIQKPIVPEWLAESGLKHIRKHGDSNPHKRKSYANPHPRRKNY